MDEYVLILNESMMQNKKLQLFTVAWDVLSDFGKDKKWIGGRIGATAILHTWTTAQLPPPPAHDCACRSVDETREVEAFAKAGQGMSDILIFVKSRLGCIPKFSVYKFAKISFFHLQKHTPYSIFQVQYETLQFLQTGQ